jgi:hypothetical protein
VETDGCEPGLRAAEAGLREVESDGRDPAARVARGRGPLVPPPERGADRRVAGFEAAAAAIFRTVPGAAGGREPAEPLLTGLAAGRGAAACERTSAGAEERDLGAAGAFEAGERPRWTEPRDAGEGPLRDRGVAAFSATVRRCGPAPLAAAGLELDGAPGGVLRGAASPRDPFFLAPVVFVGIMPPSHPGLGTGP